jgi:hypothetical protein
MTALGLRQSGRLGLSPGRRRSTSFSPVQIADLAFWYRAGDPQNSVSGGAVVQAFDLSGNGRHGSAIASGNRPLATTDPDGRSIMRFDGADDSLQVASPPSLAGGVTVFVAYRIRSHVNGQGILAAGKAGDGQGNDKWFEFSSTFSANRTQLVAKDTQANPIITAQRVDPRGDKNYAVFKIDAANAELRDFLGAVTDTGTSLAFSGVPDLIAIGARAIKQFATSPYCKIDLY